jgi:hypothetical protein
MMCNSRDEPCNRFDKDIQSGEASSGRNGNMD